MADASQLMKFKRLNDEYEAWVATQNISLPPQSANSDSKESNQKSMNQKRKRASDDGSAVDAKIRSVGTSRPGNATTSKRIPPAITPATGNTSASRTITDSLPKTAMKKEAESQTPQKQARLKQTQLNFTRTPLGPRTPNIAPQSERQPPQAIKPSTAKSSQRTPVADRERRSAQGSKVVDLLSTSKGDISPSSSFEKGPKSGKSSLPVADAPKCTPPLAKLRKTGSQKSEAVAQEIPSSQSSAASPWRPLEHLVSAEP